MNGDETESCNNILCTIILYCTINITQIYLSALYLLLYIRMTYLLRSYTQTLLHSTHEDKSRNSFQKNGSQRGIETRIFL